MRSRLHKGDQDVEPPSRAAIEFAEALDDEGTFLADDDRTLEECDNYQYGNRR